MRLLCWLGIHQWGPEYDKNHNNLPEVLLFFALMFPGKCKRKCERCNKVKKFTIQVNI